MNTSDLSLFISKNSFWTALIIMFCFLTYYVIKFLLDNEKEIRKAKDKLNKFFKNKELKGGETKHESMETKESS